MTYLKVNWNHNFPDEPIIIYSELDDNRYEIRKVEIFSNGIKGFASKTNSTHSTALGETPVPPLKEIVKDSQFEVEEITNHKFEKMWNEAVG